MKKLLTSILLGVTVFTLVSCNPKPTTVTIEDKKQYVITSDYLSKVKAWVKYVVENKDALLVQAQTDPEKFKVNMTKMETAGEIADILSQEGYTELADALYAISQAYSNFKHYLEEGDASEFTKAAQNLENAKVLYQKVK